MQFNIKFKLDLPALLSFYCSHLLIVYFVFQCILYIDIFILFLLIATKDTLFSLEFFFNKKNGKMSLLCLNCSDNDLCIWPNNVKRWARFFFFFFKSAIMTVKMQFVEVSYWFKRWWTCVFILWTEMRNHHIYIQSVLSNMSSGVLSGI